MVENEKPLPKKRGRKPGGGKVPGSGRKPGTKNAIASDMRATILMRGKPIELLCDISRGVKIRVGPQAGPAKPEYVYPTLAERTAAARVLVDKLLPAAHELTGKDGEPLNPAPAVSDMALANMLTFIAARAAKVEAAGKADADPFEHVRAEQAAALPTPEPHAQPPGREWVGPYERRRDNCPEAFREGGMPRVVRSAND